MYSNVNLEYITFFHFSQQSTLVLKILRDRVSAIRLQNGFKGRSSKQFYKRKVT